MAGEITAQSGEIGGFSITETAISSSNNNIVLKSDGEVSLSGSAVTIETPKFLLGGNSQYISGSNGFIEVSSSNIHIERDGNLTVRRVTANDGFIGGSGGFGIKDSLLHSPAAQINSPLQQPPPNQLSFEVGSNKTARRFAILADYTGSFGYYMIDAGIDGDQIAVAMMSASTKTTEDDDGAVTAHSELGFYGQGDAKSVEGKEQKVYRKMIVSAITPETTPSCFLKNTMITMADGSELPIQLYYFQIELTSHLYNFFFALYSS